MWAHAPDNGNDGVNNFSPRVDFYLGTTMVGSATASGAIDYYEALVTGVAAGSRSALIVSGTEADAMAPFETATARAAGASRVAAAAGVEAASCCPGTAVVCCLAPCSDAAVHPLNAITPRSIEH